MEKETKYAFFIVGFGVGLYALLMNFYDVWGLLCSVFSSLYPIALGCMIAFVLNVPMSFFERVLFRSRGREKVSVQSHGISFFCLMLSLVCVAVVLILVFTMLVPAVLSSLVSMRDMLAEKLPEWSEKLAANDIDSGYLTGLLEAFEIDIIVKHFAGSAGDILNSAIGFLANAVSGVANLAISLVVAIYVLLSKHRLVYLFGKLLRAFFGEKWAARIMHVSDVVCKTYSKFLSGQCVESCILGVLIYVSFSLFSVPYAALIGLLCSIMSFVPYAGGIVTFFVGAFLVGLADNSKIVLCIVIYAVVQFVENQFIYPHIVGNSVGMGALWTFLAAFAGGRLFGVVGMIFFIPLAAVVYKLVSEHVCKNEA